MRKAYRYSILIILFILFLSLVLSYKSGNERNRIKLIQELKSSDNLI